MTLNIEIPIHRPKIPPQLATKSANVYATVRLKPMN